ncbi:threonyl and Alanyl tRNA synthetase second additional domain-containing protein [Colletotrichum sp. SAR 10_70]|nr:threonyl and Alanyl tRNA synthetase second additional domain-containing protein [Colletotrichum sp. SAR 10_71]KAI8184072.1 threonyl and Alanyl tRNA synthetase second additional domain-containing protein [Colletotrichum sp. SAR 10_70]KAI8203542.1 threonyl and Alanyl tRNA synthetase second additional domain-containing protein [Colletotrichum sp. SAR 10_65]KAI8237796.1 threonyl and Alanyl tRNA synthetase second additional domain-containing protein [Colletotrichum sp. SAR 10_86]
MAVTESTKRPEVVGALACQRNSYLKTLDAEVISCEKRPPPVAKKNGGKDKSKESNGVDKSEMWLIEFDDSPLSPGDRVRQEVDFQRRWDHMQQHTGQHLLSAVMDTHENLNTLGWGMGKSGAMNYVDLPRKPTDAELQAIQARCTEIIRSSLPITVETPDDAKVHKMPEDYDQSKGVVRVIRIGDIDRNTAPQEVVQTVKRTQETSSELKKREKKLLADIAQFEAEAAKAKLEASKAVWVHRGDGNADFVKVVTVNVKDALAASGGLVVVATGEDKQGGQLVVLGQKAGVEALVPKIKDLIKDVKGGGAGDKWQGKVTTWDKGVLVLLKELVEGFSF